MGLFGSKKTDEELYAEGAASFSKGDYKHAYVVLNKLADKGHAGAQYCVGVMRHRGIEGISFFQNLDYAQEYLIKSARQGCQEAADYLQQYFGMDVTGAVTQMPFGGQQAVSNQQFAPSQQAVSGQQYASSQQAVFNQQFMPNQQAAPSQQPVSNHQGAPVPQPVMQAKPAGQEEYEQGLEAYNRGEHMTAAQLFDQAARKGHPEAQYSLAQMYQKGDGIMENKEGAVYWLREAAAAGHGEAQYSLAWCCEKGEGTNKDLEEAVSWYQKAAERGNEKAKAALENLRKQSAPVIQPAPAVQPAPAAQSASAAQSQPAAQAASAAQSQSVTQSQPAAQADPAAEMSAEEYFMLGRDAFQKEDKVQAAYYFGQAALKGLLEAQIFLGHLYEEGEGVEKSPDQAVFWYRKAAEQGNDTAQHLMGIAYLEGTGVEKDLDTARAWFQKAADQGNEDAIEILELLEDVDDVDELNDGEDEEESKGFFPMHKPEPDLTYMSDHVIEFLKEHTEEEVIQLAHNAVIAAGKELEQGNRKKAMENFGIGAQFGCPEAQYYLGVMYENLDEPNLHKARTWLRRAEAQGFKDAGKKLKRIEEGTLTPKEIGGRAATCEDEGEKMRYIEEAADAGDAENQTFLGVLLATAGKKDVSHYKTGMAYLEKAAKNGNKTAMSLVGRAYIDGEVFEKDLEKGIYWTKKAAEAGVASSQMRLAQAYLEGTGVKADEKQAFYWTKQAADQEDMNGMRMIGAYYALGVGTPVDQEKGKRYLKKCIAQGDEAAKDIYKKFY